MDIYKARWENAKRIAVKINSYLDAGCIVFNEDGEMISEKFTITDSICCGNVGYFYNNKNCDEGLYTTIDDYNSKFKKWKIVRPEHIISLF